MFPDDFYTLSEIAAILKVSKPTVWRKAKAGTFPPLDPVFCRFRGDHLRDWLDAQQPPQHGQNQAA